MLFFKKLGITWPVKQHHIPEELIPHPHHCENFKTGKFYSCV